MLKSFKFWFCIALCILLVGIVVAEIFGIHLQVDYLTGILSVVLSIMITLGLIDKDLPSKTDAESIKMELTEAQEKIEETINDKDKAEKY